MAWTTKTWILTLALLLALGALSLGCKSGDDDDDDSVADDDTADDDTTDDDTADDDTSDDDTSDDDTTDDDTGDDDTVETVTYDFPLILEFRNTAQLHLEVTGDAIEGSFTAAEGYGNEFIPANTELSGEGKLMTFEEAKYEMFTLEFSGGPVTDGPCGAETVNYALTLNHQIGQTELNGGITCRCGDDLRYKGMLRIQTGVYEGGDDDE
ncbi:MAG: hypothetical protein H6684_12335 [Deltaproteobacteria bacterium]|nr:hypothetical protein [bacterium]MCB9489514.1 hypothetical protein [Deltaproteobacteria bacterium]